MGLDFALVQQALLSPEIWWVYELMFVFAYFVIRFFKHWGKDIHLIGDFDKGGIFHVIARYWVDPLAKTFKTRGKRWFYSGRESAPMTEEHIGGSSRVVLHLLSRGRPRRVDIVDKDGNPKKEAEEANAYLKIDPQLPLVKQDNKDSKKIKYIEQDDPMVSDFSDFMDGETKRQVAAGSTGSINFGRLMIILVFAVGLSIGVMAIAIGFPHGIFPASGSNCIPTIINGTARCAPVGALP